jgi:hypothetical protein
MQTETLNRPDYLQKRSLGPAPWMAGDISHIDSNGVGTQDFGSIHFSAGRLDNEQHLRRSEAMLKKYGVEEIVSNGPTSQDDDSLSSLP